MRAGRLLLSSALVAAALAHAAPGSIQLRKVETPAVIDGIIDPVWSHADSTSDFVQQSPYYGKPPSRPTTARILTTDEALYCLFVCYDSRENIEDPTGVLDQDNGDLVSLMIDSFDDHQTAYQFVVTAAGVQSDARLLDDARNRDFSWDGVWLGAARVYDWGFVAEMKVPYKSIRYGRDLQEWGVDFHRWISSSQEEVCWSRYVQSEDLRVSKFGRLHFDGFRPMVSGMNMEIYPVAISRARLLDGGRYKVDPDAGIDVFYNPSEMLTFQLTANPDFAQIEADPFQFNITRYETYFDERRPFFTEGNEIFMAAGKQNSSGFYRPLQLFYSRRIGTVLPDGETVPLQVGTKAFGRVGEWQYGGFYAHTGETRYRDGSEWRTEPRASFISARVKRQILENSTVGAIFVGKSAGGEVNGVLDIDGAFRGPAWQLSYQLARSIQGSRGDYAASAGFMHFGDTWLNFVRTRLIGETFDVNAVGFVPWKGTRELTAITGPVMFYKQGSLRQLLIYVGGSLTYEHADLFTDRIAVLGINMQFRDNWGYELTVDGGTARDNGTMYRPWEITLSSWFNVSPRWHGNLWTGYSRTYNFERNYVAPYFWFGSTLAWRAATTLEVGSDYNMYLERTPAGAVEEITYNARPYFSFTPFNNLNVRLYVDNVLTRSSGTLERVVGGLLFSYNFLPKSWIYLAFNEIRNRDQEFDPAGVAVPHRLHVVARAGVAKVKYLYYL